MRQEIVDRAKFLLEELHLSAEDAQQRLRIYFPDLELEERIRHVREASRLLARTSGRAGLPTG